VNLDRAGLLARKEWKESFNSPTPYIALGLFFILIGWFWTSALFLTGQATMEEFFGPLPLLLGIFLPAFTMRLFAEEYKTGTIENLATLPLEDIDIVLGKFAAALAVWGVMLGLVWSPCAGPILGSILTLVAAKRDLVQAGSLLLAYAIGAGLPMLLIAYGGQAAVGKVRAVSAHAAMIQRVFGVVIVVVGLAIGFGLDRSVQAWLVQASPGLFLNLSIGL
jgi:cytochrome c biogenesis protein CcdA